MGASVIGLWPDITDDQLEDQPGFFNDTNAWGAWMAARMERPAILELHKALGVEPLLSYTTEGIEESATNWVTPDQMAAAATRLRDMVLAKDPRIAPMLEVYAADANGLDPVEKEFARDLQDVAKIAAFAKEQGVTKMTLEVNW